VGTKDIVSRMLREKLDGSIDEETMRRFKNAADYQMKKGAFEKPLVAMRLPDGLSVIDGNHRISAFCGLQDM